MSLLLLGMYIKVGLLGYRMDIFLAIVDTGSKFFNSNYEERVDNTGTYYYGCCQIE